MSDTDTASTIADMVAAALDVARTPNVVDTIFTLDRQTAFMQGLAMGLNLDIAAHSVSIPPALVRRWVSQGAECSNLMVTDPEWEPSEMDMVHLSFYLRMMATLADLEMSLAGAVKHEAVQGGDWRAAMTMLERLHPERWAKQSSTSVNVSGSIGHQVEQVTSSKANDVLNALGARLAEIDAREQGEVLDAEIVED